MLDELAESWDVSLTSHAAPSGASAHEWELTLHGGRGKDWRTYRYRGALAVVIARAWAGEPGD